MLVGLTGGIGSGKTTVAKIFAEYDNVIVYYADVEAKKLMNTSDKIKEQLIKIFSEDVYVEGKLNRSYLAEIVFKDKEKLTTLNSIVHPEVYDHLTDFIEKNKEKAYIIYENAILFENGSDQMCDKIITVTAPEQIRLQRVVKRDNSTEQMVKERMQNQWTEVKKTIQSNYIVTNVDLYSTKNQVNKIHNKLTQS